MNERPQHKRSVFWLATAGDEESFEKFPAQARNVMPVSSQRRIARSLHKTDASRRTGRRISQTLGGIHRRRNKRHG
jgi:hypothetical protein